MNMEFVLREVDRLFDENKAKEAESFLLNALEEAKAEADGGVCLQILNELIGYYRQTSERDKLEEVIGESFRTAEELELQGTIWYGTTALNAANGYRSIGKLDISRKYYDEAEEIYDKKLSEKDMLFAGLYNNRSLLEQEVGNFQRAEEYLLKALEIVQKNQSGFEIAVTYANLANTMVQGKEFEKAKDYAKKAILCFEKRKLYDAHYCAALSALGMCYFHEGRIDEARQLFEEGMMIVENTLGRNTQYQRLKENRDACIPNQKKEEGGNAWKELGALLREELGKKEEQPDIKPEREMTGLELCKRYYETYGKPMLEKQFPEVVSRIAVGLVGEGSDCLGYDDEYSRDHDWGPGFCIFLPKELENEYGDRLRKAYAELPDEFLGYRRVTTGQGSGRVGVMTIEDFYRRYAGMSEDGIPDFRNTEDASLLACTDGEVFTDPEGRFSEIRALLQKGYPEEIRFLKLAEDAARISQTGQYNYSRMLERGDRITADRMLSDCIGHIMRLWHHLCQAYPPHDKWLWKSLLKLDGGEEIAQAVTKLHAGFRMDDEAALRAVPAVLETICEQIARRLYEESIISDVDAYLDHHVEELLMKASYAPLTDQELAEKIARVEFEAFDKVKNEGGRAYCQNDWPTFSVMRKSQYLTWDRTMLMQYLYDFEREWKLGHNLITEKYGRMMESTAPERYQELERHFPEIPAEKKAVIEQIVALQMDMVETLAKEYPKVVANARNLHTYEDNVIDTSYETYLRGEISTYSDKMLQLYAGYVIRWVREGQNIARAAMENTARLYGYRSLDDFQSSIS